jgi:hypothetical protein
MEIVILRQDLCPVLPTNKMRLASPCPVPETPSCPKVPFVLIIPFASLVARKCIMQLVAAKGIHYAGWVLKE